MYLLKPFYRILYWNAYSKKSDFSKYKDMIILKGGMLITSMVGINNRTTMDMDATVTGYPLSEETIQTALSELFVQLDDEVSLVVDQYLPIREG